MIDVVTAALIFAAGAGASARVRAGGLVLISGLFVLASVGRGLMLDEPVTRLLVETTVGLVVLQVGFLAGCMWLALPRRWRSAAGKSSADVTADARLPVARARSK